MKFRILGVFLKQTKEGKPKIRWTLIILLSFLIFILINGILLPFLDRQSRETKIKDDVAYQKLVVGNIPGFEYAVSDVSDTIFDIAKKYPKINKIVIHLYLGTGWHKGGCDHETLIGDLNITDLSEARKYYNSEEYSKKTQSIYWDKVTFIDKNHLIENYGKDFFK